VVERGFEALQVAPEESSAEKGVLPTGPQDVRSESVGCGQGIIVV
jgi:hypothetical protein